MKVHEKYLEFEYTGGLMLEKILIRKSSITSVQKPKNGNGCIVQAMSEKFPVGDSYESVVSELLKD